MKRHPTSIYSVNSLKKGLSILECFTPRKHHFSLSEITKVAGISKTTAFRLLNTFCELDYLKYDSENKKYYLGPRVLSLGFSVLQSLDIREIARPYLEMLAKEFDKTVNLSILDKTEMVYIDRIKVHSIRDFNINIGDRIPVYNTAAGRAVLAYLEREKLLGMLKEIKKHPNGSRFIGKDGNKLIRILDNVRANGFSISDEEVLRGVRAIAVPVFSQQKEYYAVNVVVASELVSVNELKTKYAPKLAKVGKELSKAMGSQGVK
jgi:IclR family pca regulon transcriptional regulator